MMCMPNLMKMMTPIWSIGGKNFDKFYFILIEEMPAYFAGQKTLEQVIPVMQNRIQKVLDERK